MNVRITEYQDAAPSSLVKGTNISEKKRCHHFQRKRVSRV
jgi:hypothetical protein